MARIKRRDQFEVYVARNEQQGHVVQAHLANFGIDAMVVGGQLVGGVGELPMGWECAPRIWVAEADKEKARTIILEWEQAIADSNAMEAAPWVCSVCGEQVTATFDICWNCTADRPAAEPGPSAIDEVE